MNWEINFLLELNKVGAQNADLNWLSQILRVITFSVDKGIIWIILAIVLLFFKKTRKLGIYLGVGLLVFSLLLNNVVIKHIVNRTRPFDMNDELKQYVLAWMPEKGFLGFFAIPSDASFMSGHTLTSFLCATIIFAFHKKTGILAYFYACLVGFSRLYFGVHYPTDVIFGAVFGVVLGCISYLLTKQLEEPVLSVIRKIITNRKNKNSKIA